MASPMPGPLPNDIIRLSSPKPLLRPMARMSLLVVSSKAGARWRRWPKRLVKLIGVRPAAGTTPSNRAKLLKLQSSLAVSRMVKASSYKNNTHWKTPLPTMRRIERMSMAEKVISSLSVLWVQAISMSSLFFFIYGSDSLLRLIFPQTQCLSGPPRRPIRIFLPKNDSRHSSQPTNPHLMPPICQWQ